MNEIMKKEARDELAKTITGYLLKHNLKAKEFSSMFCSHFDYTLSSMMHAFLAWKDGRRPGYTGNFGRIQPFAPIELKKISTLLRIMGIKEDDPLISKIKEAESSFEYSAR